MDEKEMLEEIKDTCAYCDYCPSCRYYNQKQEECSFIRSPFKWNLDEL